MKHQNKQESFSEAGPLHTKLGEETPGDLSSPCAYAGTLSPYPIPHIFGLCPVLGLEDTGADRSCVLGDTDSYWGSPVLKELLLQRHAQGAKVRCVWGLGAPQVQLLLLPSELVASTLLQDNDQDYKSL